MGRKPLSSAVKRASGAFKKDPQRENKNEPQPTFGRPVMSELVASDPDLTKTWNHLCDHLEAMNLLTVSEGKLIEQACLIYQNVMESHAIRKRDGLLVEGRHGNLVRNPVSADYHKACEMWLKILGELGLTPSARTRLTAAPSGDQDNPLVDFLNRHQNVEQN